jgi:putative ABC transport system substrate-binding protein
MRRREVIAGIGAAALAAPLAARAQQPATPVIGFLTGRSRAEVGPALAEFHRGLGDLGFVEGTNVAIDYQWAEGRYDRLPELAAALVERPVTVIAATGGNTAASPQRRRPRPSPSCSRLAATRSRWGSCRASTSRAGTRPA